MWSHILHISPGVDLTVGFPELAHHQCEALSLFVFIYSSYAFIHVFDFSVFGLFLPFGYLPLGILCDITCVCMTLILLIYSAIGLATVVTICSCSDLSLSYTLTLLFVLDLSACSYDNYIGSILLKRLSPTACALAYDNMEIQEVESYMLDLRRYVLCTSSDIYCFAI